MRIWDFGCRAAARLAIWAICGPEGSRCSGNSRLGIRKTLTRRDLRISGRSRNVPFLSGTFRNFPFRSVSFRLVPRSAECRLRSADRRNRWGGTVCSQTVLLETRKAERRVRSAECGEHPRNPFPLFVRVACGSKQERHCAARTYALGARRGTFRFFPELSETFRFVPFHSGVFRFFPFCSVLFRLIPGGSGPGRGALNPPRCTSWT